MHLMSKIFHKFDKYMSQFIVIFGISIILLYTIAVLLITCNTSNTVPDSLTNGVFGFFGVELLSLAGIKITKHFRVGKSIEDTVNDIMDNEDEDSNGEEDK